jgi:hypothetical protein
MSCCDVAAEMNADSDDMSRHLQTTQHVRRGPSIVFAGSVIWTEKIHRTELNRTAVWSFFQLQLPKFCVIPVAGCLI